MTLMRNFRKSAVRQGYVIEQVSCVCIPTSYGHVVLAIQLFHHVTTTPCILYTCILSAGTNIEDSSMRPSVARCRYSVTLTYSIYHDTCLYLVRKWWVILMSTCHAKTTV